MKSSWTQHQIGHVSSELAVEQWRGFFEKVSALANVKLIRGDPAWPDLVFTANAGLPLAHITNSSSPISSIRSGKGKEPLSEPGSKLKGGRASIYPTTPYLKELATHSLIPQAALGLRRTPFG